MLILLLKRGDHFVFPPCWEAAIEDIRVQPYRALHQRDGIKIFALFEL